MHPFKLSLDNDPVLKLFNVKSTYKYVFILLLICLIVPTHSFSHSFSHSSSYNHIESVESVERKLQVISDYQDIGMMYLKRVEKLEDYEGVLIPRCMQKSRYELNYLNGLPIFENSEEDPKYYSKSQKQLLNDALSLCVDDIFTNILDNRYRNSVCDLSSIFYDKDYCLKSTISMEARDDQIEILMQHLIDIGEYNTFPNDLLLMTNSMYKNGDGLLDMYKYIKSYEAFKSKYILPTLKRE